MADSMSEGEKLTILLEFYRLLREEILETIKLQNRILTGEGVAVGVIFGLSLGLATIFKILITAIPPIIVVFTSQWIIEQSRMMRAGDYLYFLEDKINNEIGRSYISWENWLRSEVGRYLIHRIHHYAQYLCFIFLFYGMGIISLYLFYKNVELLLFLKIIFIELHIFLLAFLAFCLYKVIEHRERKEDKSKFQKFEKEYLQGITKIYESNKKIKDNARAKRPSKGLNREFFGQDHTTA